MTASQRIALVTDSTCDVPAALVERYGIVVLPQVIIWGQEELRDGIDITPDAFYRRLATDPAHPTTSQPVVSDFFDVFTALREGGVEAIVVVAISSQLSGTLESARQAAAMIDDLPIHVVDSRSASMGLGFQVLAAARARESGATPAKMAAAAEQARSRMQVYFSPETLEYLHRGGRIGGAARLIGSALQLKPLLMVDHATGRVEPAERTRTRSKALERIVQAFVEHLTPDERLHAAVLHGAAPDDAEAVKRALLERVIPHELIETSVAPVVGVHTGPGTIGICGYQTA